MSLFKPVNNQANVFIKPNLLLILVSLNKPKFFNNHVAYTKITNKTMYQINVTNQAKITDYTSVTIQANPSNQAKGIGHINVIKEGKVTD